MSARFELIAAEKADPTSPYPVVRICASVRVETLASSRASFTTSTRTFPAGAWPRSWRSASRCDSSVSSA